MPPYDPETPVHDLAKRRAEIVKAVDSSEDDRFTAACRLCGDRVPVFGETVMLWRRFNRRLRAGGSRPLAANEIVICGSPRCRAENTRQMDERSERERRELQTILRDVCAGRTVHVPAELIRNHPVHYAIIQDWILWRRRGSKKAPKEL
jgi:hypothetical protein